MRSIIRFYGGKNRISHRIIPYLPEHITYVEPFGGAASILLNKEPSEVEVYNDIDKELVNLFKVLRDAPDELRHQLHLTPWSREEFRRAIEPVDESVLSELERARRTVVKYRQGRAGKGQTTEGQWAYCIKSRSRGMPQVISAWLSAIDDVLPKLADRLMRVQMECESWEKIIPRYDDEDTLFYCDPPYYPESRSGSTNVYKHEMSADDHERLAEMLNSVRGSVVLSGYSCPQYLDWYGDWEEVAIPTETTVQTVREESRASNKRTEMLWIKEVT